MVQHLGSVKSFDVSLSWQYIKMLRYSKYEFEDSIFDFDEEDFLRNDEK